MNLISTQNQGTKLRLIRSTMASLIKRQRIGPKVGFTCTSLIDLLDDPILRKIIAFLPDPETVCTLGGCCTRLQNLVKGETVIWDRFLEQIPILARPFELNLDRTAKEIVLRFSSARLFASRMERIAPLHRVMLGQGNYCQGCIAFPDAEGYSEGYELACEERGDVFFVRYSVRGSLIWQGFLPSRTADIFEDISLGYKDEDFSLSEEFDWPEMKAYLAYPPPRNRFGDPDLCASKWREEKRRMVCAMFKQLTLTIVVIKDDITDRHLAICTCGLDEDELSGGGSYRAPHMEIMPEHSHGFSPVGPVEKGYCCHPYYRTTEDKINYAGNYVVVGHYFSGSFSGHSTERYIGPFFNVCGHYDGTE